jgi:hypothetical protein
MRNAVGAQYFEGLIGCKNWNSIMNMENNKYLIEPISEIYSIPALPLPLLTALRLQ